MTQINQSMLFGKIIDLLCDSYKMRANKKFWTVQYQTRYYIQSSQHSIGLKGTLLVTSVYIHSLYGNMYMPSASSGICTLETRVSFQKEFYLPLNFFNFFQWREITMWTLFPAFLASHHCCHRLPKSDRHWNKLSIYMRRTRCTAAHSHTVCRPPASWAKMYQLCQL